MQDNRYSVSFVMPMFNERENIGRAIGVVHSIAARLCSDYEIIVVDDASKDGSADLVQEIASGDGRVRLFRLENNTNFGGALAEGFRRATRDVILYMDSDMPVAIEDIEASLPLISGCDVVNGYSKIKKGSTLKRKVISFTYNLMIQALFGLNVRDINSGYKIIRRDIIKDARFVSRSPFVDVELFIHAKRKGGTIKQFPLIFRLRTGGESTIARLPVIWATFRDMMKVRFSLLK